MDKKKKKNQRKTTGHSVQSCGDLVIEIPDLGISLAASYLSE